MDALALYAAAIGTASFVWHVVAWHLSRRVKLAVEVVHTLTGANRYRLAVKVRNRSERRPIFIESTGLRLVGHEHERAFYAQSVREQVDAGHTATWTLTPDHQTWLALRPTQFFAFVRLGDGRYLDTAATTLRAEYVKRDKRLREGE